jgi:hypothetical protein
LAKISDQGLGVDPPDFPADSLWEKPSNPSGCINDDGSFGPVVMDDFSNGAPDEGSTDELDGFDRCKNYDAAACGIRHDTGGRRGGPGRRVEVGTLGTRSVVAACPFTGQDPWPVRRR